MGKSPISKKTGNTCKMTDNADEKADLEGGKSGVATATSDQPISDCKVTRSRTSLALLQQSGTPTSDNVPEDLGGKRHREETDPDGDGVKSTKVPSRKASHPLSDGLGGDVPQPRLNEITDTQHDKGKIELVGNDNVEEYEGDDVGSDTDIDRDEDDTFPRLNTRSSASIFVKAITNLSNAKKQAVREMGLGRLLELGITATPSKMGFWLVDSFNHMDRKLQLYGGEKVHVKEDDVYVALGLPRGVIEIQNKKKRATSALLDEWIALFNVRRPSNITASKVLEKINECVDGDDWFKRHFVVLMVTCLFESCLNGMANSRVVHMLDDLSNVGNMNWCSYMIRCLVDSKRSWDANGKQKFTGPLLFLTLFYVDRVV